MSLITAGGLRLRYGMCASETQTQGALHRGASLSVPESLFSWGTVQGLRESRRRASLQDAQQTGEAVGADRLQQLAAFDLLTVEVPIISHVLSSRRSCRACGLAAKGILEHISARDLLPGLLLPSCRSLCESQRHSALVLRWVFQSGRN